MTSLPGEVDSLSPKSWLVQMCSPCVGTLWELGGRNTEVSLEVLPRVVLGRIMSFLGSPLEDMYPPRISDVQVDLFDPGKVLGNFGQLEMRISQLGIFG
jgi:hypothetical protein